MTKRLHCAWCGADLGEATKHHWPGDIESCGKPECDRHAREMERERDEQAREAAEDDGYSRYGGSGR